MATYAQAARARKLIDRVATLNNGVLNTIKEAIDLRSELLALSTAEQDAIRTAIRDLGYDDTEIVQILGNFNQLNAHTQTLNMDLVSSPFSR